MSVHGLFPEFSSANEYKAWKHAKSLVYRKVSSVCRARKLRIKELQRQGKHDEVKQARASYIDDRSIAQKMNTLNKDGKARRDQLLGIRKSLKEQFDSFPLSIEKCRVVDIHFNKKSLEIPSIPMWVVKTRGKTYYVNHINCQLPWNTMEKAEGATRGLIRVSGCSLLIDKEGIAHITPK